jgi:hypothetical protein
MLPQIPLVDPSPERNVPSPHITWAHGPNLRPNRPYSAGGLRRETSDAATPALCAPRPPRGRVGRDTEAGSAASLSSPRPAPSPQTAGSCRPRCGRGPRGSAGRCPTSAASTRPARRPRRSGVLLGELHRPRGEAVGRRHDLCDPVTGFVAEPVEELPGLVAPDALHAPHARRRGKRSRQRVERRALVRLRVRQLLQLPPPLPRQVVPRWRPHRAWRHSCFPSQDFER